MRQRAMQSLLPGIRPESGGEAPLLVPELRLPSFIRFPPALICLSAHTTIKVIRVSHQARRTPITAQRSGSNKEELRLQSHQGEAGR